MSPFATIRLVAMREIRERLRSRVFLTTTLIGAVIVCALIVIPTLRDDEIKTYDVALVKVGDPVIRAAVENSGTVANVKIRVKDYTSVDKVRADVRAGRVDIALVESRRVIVGDPPPRERLTTKARLIAAISEAARLQTALTDAGLSTEQAAKALSTEPLPVQALGKPTQPSRDQFTTLMGVMAIFIFFQQYGGWILIGVAEEKSSRIAEVLLAAVKPRHLVTGKILGIGVVGLTQALFVAVSAIVTSRVVGSNILAGAEAWGALAAVGWFILGFSLYGPAFAAAGSLVNRQGEAQAAGFPVMIPIMAGYFATISAIGQANPSMLLKVLAFLPPTAPLCMPTLISLNAVEPWQVGMAALGVAVTGAVVARLAGAIYANAILRTGKRIKWTEALRSS